MTVVTKLCVVAVVLMGHAIAQQSAYGQCQYENPYFKNAKLSLNRWRDRLLWVDNVHFGLLLL